ncbi:MAG: hypothetical protein [Bacteriophage sp.]|nr:MAG: hypothetical protein [Bacteriophage sp.]
MTILTFPLVVTNGAQQLINPPGGVDQATYLYIGFQTLPSAGTVLIEGQRPGASAWTAIYNGTAAGAATMCDGGFGALRVTFSGLAGAANPSISLVAAQTVMLPSKLVTDGGFGPSARLRVDTGQTGFFAGRMFRSFLQGVVPVAGPTVQFRIFSPIDFVLWSNEISLTQGAVQMSLYTGATPSGTWTKAPTIGVNRMQSRPQPYYESPIYLESGGDFTGGTLVDPVPVRAPAGNNNADNVKESASERGLPAGTYYGRISTLTGGLQVNDDAHFTYKPSWEDRPT